VQAGSAGQLSGARLAFYNQLAGAKVGGTALTKAMNTADGMKDQFEAIELTVGTTPSLPSGYPGYALTDTSDAKLTALTARSLVIPSTDA